MFEDEAGMHLAVYYSLGRLMLSELVLLTLGVLPVLPGMENRVTYYKALYEWPLYALIIFASFVIASFFLLSLLLLVKAVKSEPALILIGDEVTLHKVRSRRFSKSEVASLDGSDANNLSVTLKDGSNITIPIFLFKNPKKSRELIMRALST